MQSETTDSTRLYELLAWLEMNRKRVISIACLVLSVIVLFYIFSWYREQHELKASHALLSLHSSRRASTDATATSPADFLKVASGFSSTAAAKHALLLAAGAFYTDAKYSDAQTQFQRFLDQQPRSPLASVAALGIAACLDALDHPNEATAAYQNVIDRYPEDAAAIQARLALAALHETQNRPEKALQIYDELGRQTGTSSGASDAAARRERLLQQHPNLAATNPVPATAKTNPAATPAAQPAPATTTNSPAPR
jgi:predicted negative regulator of RcsB-dependent stress response